MQHFDSNLTEEESQPLRSCIKSKDSAKRNKKVVLPKEPEPPPPPLIALFNSITAAFATQNPPPEPIQPPTLAGDDEWCDINHGDMHQINEPAASTFHHGDVGQIERRAASSSFGQVSKGPDVNQNQFFSESVGQEEYSSESDWISEDCENDIPDISYSVEDDYIESNPGNRNGPPAISYPLTDDYFKNLPKIPAPALPGPVQFNIFSEQPSPESTAQCPQYSIFTPGAISPVHQSSIVRNFLASPATNPAVYSAQPPAPIHPAPFPIQMCSSGDDYSSSGQEDDGAGGGEGEGDSSSSDVRMESSGGDLSHGRPSSGASDFTEFTVKVSSVGSSESDKSQPSSSSSVIGESRRSPKPEAACHNIFVGAFAPGTEIQADNTWVDCPVSVYSEFESEGRTDELSSNNYNVSGEDELESSFYSDSDSEAMEAGDVGGAADDGIQWLLSLAHKCVPFIPCRDFLMDVPGYDFRGGVQGKGYYREQSDNAANKILGNAKQAARDLLYGKPQSAAGKLLGNPRATTPQRAGKSKRLQDLDYWKHRDPKEVGDDLGKIGKSMLGKKNRKNILQKAGKALGNVVRGQKDGLVKEGIKQVKKFLGGEQGVPNVNMFLTKKEKQKKSESENKGSDDDGVDEEIFKLRTKFFDPDFKYKPPKEAADNEDDKENEAQQEGGGADPDPPKAEMKAYRPGVAYAHHWSDLHTDMSRTEYMLRKKSMLKLRLERAKECRRQIEEIWVDGDTHVNLFKWETIFSR